MVLLDGLFAWLSIPVVSMDFLLLGLSLVMIIIGFNLRVGLNDLYKTRAAVSLPVWHRIGYTLFMILLICMGAFLAIEGFNNPFELFTGVKGASHGYTVFVLGTLITLYSLVGLIIFFPGGKKSA
jgi:hypothetical protein